MIRHANILLFSCLTVFNFLISSFVLSQSLPDNISFERITIPGTIRSSQVSDIIQDKHGLIWLAGDGIYRYDGFKFRQYRELEDGRILGPQDVHFLLYDSVADRLLLATHRFGIVKYDYNTDKLVALSHRKEQPILHLLTQSADGKIWVASYFDGLLYLENDSLKKLPDPTASFQHPSSLATIGSTLYIGSPDKIVVVHQQQVVEEIKLRWQGKELPTSTLPTTIFVDRHKNLWIGTEKQGVLVYDLAKKEFTKYFPPSMPPFFTKITRILEDREGFIWILTKASGVVVYDPKQNRMLTLMKDPFSAKSISSDNSFSIVEDREGIIWLGGTGDINKYDRQQLKFQHIYHNPLNKLSLTDNMVRGVYEDREGVLWIGTDGGYINMIDVQTQSIRHIRVKLRGDSTNYVPLYFLEINANILLIGTPQGLLQYDRNTNLFSPYQPLWKLTKGRIIRQLIYSNNHLYFIHNGMLFLYNTDTTDLQKFGMAGDSLARNITAIHLDDQQRLWLGTSNGVSRYDGERNTFHFIPFHGLPSFTTNAMLLVLSIEQVGNKLYVGTFNAGLWEVDITNIHAIPPPQNYLEKDGLTSNTVYASLPDSHGDLWLSTNHGLVKFEPDKHEFISFSISEGLQEEEFNRLAYSKTKTGALVYGGINGINVFHPDSIHIVKEKFAPTIHQVTIHNPASPASSDTKLVEGKTNLTLPYDQNFIDIHFFVPHYKSPKRYSLFYKLENFEKEWKEATHENTATYANLQPGHYNFLLKTTGINGAEVTVPLALVISPPYWKTWWFISMAICIVAFLLTTMVNGYIRKTKNDRQRLEDLLTIRTSEIEKSREELQVLNQKKDLIFSILSHDLRSPLTTLKGFLGYIIDHADELTTHELKKHATNIKNSVSNSLDLIDNTLFWSLSQMGNIQYTPANFSLQPLLEKLHGLYQLTADKKRIPLSIVCAEDIVVYGDENMIYVSLRNLVSNALKFTAEGNPVIISCERKDNVAEIMVTDKGIGMSEEYLHKLLSMDQPMLKKGTSNEKGTGLGLLLCKKFIEMNKGQIRITSTEHEGTTFTVTVPLAVHQPAPAIISKP
jgi:signal transduction histidine kinase/ligand-binding sensor domain-containing protein